jgi:hypothetical protein
VEVAAVAKSHKVPADHAKQKVLLAVFFYWQICSK